MGKIPATVHFTDDTDTVTDTAEVRNVVWKAGGWVGLLAEDGWVYYPPHAIGRIVSRRGGEGGRDE